MPEQVNKPADITKDIVDAAFQVHKELGPGLLESAYEHCLCFELSQRGFLVERQKPLPLVYKGEFVEVGYRLDIVVNNEIIVELKSIDAILPIHRAQLITYLKLASIKTGFIINFNTKMIKDGIVRLSV